MEVLSTRDDSPTTFGKLLGSQVFSFDQRIYIRMSLLPDGTGYNAFRTSDGTLATFSDDAPVTLHPRATLLLDGFL